MSDVCLNSSLSVLAACIRRCASGMGAHSLPVVLGRRSGIPRAQRLCQRCNLHALDNERHLVFECPAMQCVRDRYPALFRPG